MKLNKNIFICALLVLMMLVCINAASASDSLDVNLTAEDASDVVSVDADEETLSEGNTIIVDSGGSGEYTKISDAVSAANGGDTIYIKNGEYTDSLTFTKSVNLIGESKEGVSIKTGSSSALLATTSGNNPLLSFENITFKDSARTSSGVISFMGNGNVTFINCNFADLSSKYGAIQTNTAGTITISKCTFDNIKEKSNSPGTGLMYLNGAGTTNIYDCEIKNCGYQASSGQMNALIYEYSKTGTLNIERTTIVNTTGAATSLIRSAGKVNIKDSVIENNTISLSSAGYVGDSLFYVTGEMNIETSIIANNNGPKVLLYKNTAADFSMNYCNLQNNEFNGGFTDTTAGEYDVNNNYWGSNELPTGVTASSWIVENNGVYEYNNGDALDVVIPGLNDEPAEPVAAIYVSTTGSDDNDGLTKDTAVASLKHAIEIAQEGKIIVLAGEYTIDATLAISKDLDITGQGEVVIDGNSLRIIENTANLNLTNIIFKNAKSTMGSAILDDGNMTITDCTFLSNSATGSSSGNIINNRKGTMTIKNSKFSENVASRGVVASQSGTTLNIIGCEFSDNDMTSMSTTYGMVYSASADTVIEDTVFRNNKAKSGGAIYATRASSSTTGTLDITNCIFDNNIANQGTGGAIFAGRTPTTIKDSTFTNNQATNGQYVKGQGGAIYQTMDDPKSQMTIDNCIFINNTAGDVGAAIYVNTDQGTFDIANSIIINKEGDDTYAIDKKEKATTVITADNNYWGNNTNVNFDLSEDSEIILNVAVSPVGAQAGDQVTVTAKFSKDVPTGLEIGFTTDSGNLDKTVAYNNDEISFKYTLDEADKEITVLINGIPQFKVPVSIETLDVIYVSPKGSDSNNGDVETPVATIEHAIELAVKGQIVVLEGTYKVSDLGTISDDLNITGNGTVIIDAQNSNRVLYVGSDANVVLKNLILINGYAADESGALLGNANKLTLINCTLANSSTNAMFNGGAIYNVGQLTIINSTIANNTAREGGAIFTNNALAKGASISIINSTIENNVANGNDNLGGGAIFAQQVSAITIENTTFKNNKALTTSSGGAIFVSHSDATIKISDSEFIANHANGKDSVGGGAIYMASGSNYQKQGTLTITDTLFDSNTADSNGGAIYVRATTLNVANSVLVDNDDANGYAIYGYKTDVVSPTVTVNDNWWGSNDKPTSELGGNGFTPSVARWAILTINNDTPIVEGETVKLTVAINQYTTGTENGTLSSPIDVKVPVTIKTNLGDIEGVLENGEFNYDLTVQSGLKYISVESGDASVPLLIIPTETSVVVSDVTAKQGERAEFEIAVTGIDGTTVTDGSVEVYIDGTLVATIDVNDGVANKIIRINNEEGTYDIVAKYVDDSGLFTASEDTATLTVDGVNDVVTQDNFFDFFTEDGTLLDDVIFDELTFKGNFEDLVDVITLNRAISIIGDEAVLNNIAINVKADDISLSDLTLNADVDFADNNGAAIYVSGIDVTLDNVIVNYTVPDDTEGFGIFAEEASGFTLVDSKILFDGNNLNGEVKNHALRIWECDEVLVQGTLINATLPSVNCDFSVWGTMDTDLVLAVGIQGGENILFTENEVFSNVKAAQSGYPTLDTIIVHSAKDIEISHNNITETDSSGEGIPGYSYVVDLYNFNGATVAYNNIYVKTTTGIEGAGAAYCVQATGPYTGFVVDNNNITAIGRGPALGIYSQNYNGATDITVTNNYINITGLATGNYYALVSGMELQDSVAKVYNNTIYSYNVEDGTDGLFGISYAQSTGGSHIFDIQNNTVITDGQYAVFLVSAKDSTVSNNILYSDELLGDEAVNIGGGSGNVVEDNYPIVCPTILVEATDVFEGQATTVTVTVPDATGSVTIRVNNKEYTVDLVDGVAVKDIDDYGEDFNVEVTYNGDLKYLPNVNSTTFDIIDNIVTPEDFYTYFEDDGDLRNVVSYDELIFKGEFNDFPTIFIDRAITLTGDEAVFNNFGFEVTASDVTIQGFNISYISDEGAIAINVLDSDGIVIKNNNIYFESHVSDDSEYSCAINIDGVDDILVEGNKIKTSMPGLYASNYDWEYMLMGLNTVNPVRIKNADGLEFLNNDVHTEFNEATAAYPTVQCLYLIGSENVLVDGNNFTMIDTVSEEGTSSYLYAITFGYDKSTVISNNNFYVSTLSGMDSAGTAYALQGVESELSIIGNNITCISNGPNIGIYVTSMMGESSEVDIEYNTINVTGAAETGNQWALISGIEMTNGNAKIYNNTIYTFNKNGYVEDAPVYGISYGQWMYGDRSADAQDNTIYTEGKYTVSFLDGSGVSIVNNYLVANELKGDDSVNNVEIVKDNFPAKANLVVSVDDITVGETAIITISIHEKVANDVEVIVNGKSYDVEINGGKGTLEIPDLAAGDYTVKAVYAGDRNILADENTTSFTVNKIESEMTITIGDITIGEPLDITVAIPGATGEVTVVVDGDKQVLSLVDGSATYTVPAIAIGDHSVTAVYLGDNTHDLAINTTKFTVDKLTTALNITSVEIDAGEVAEIDISVDEKATGKVLVKVNDKSIFAVIENGKAHLSISGLAFGTYDIAATYTGDELYAEAENNTAKVIVNALDSGLKADASDITVKQNATINVEINSEITSDVKVVLNDKEYPVTLTNGKGVVNIPDLADGSYTAKVIFAGNDKFAAKEVEVTFKVSKADIPGDVNISMDIPEGTTSPSFSVTLPEDATGTLSVFVDGKEYSKELVNGSATITVENLTVGDHNISVAYSGDDKYDSIKTENTTVNIPKASIPGGDKAISMDTPEGTDSPSYSINLPKDATGNLTVTVDGVNYTQPLVNGSATVNVPKLASGNHNVTVTYSGDSKYSSISKSTTLKVPEPVVKLTENKNIVMLYSAQTPYKVRVTVDGKAVGAGETVTIKYNGKTYNVKTDKNGYATLKLPNVKPKKAKYTITAQYKGVTVKNTVKVNSIIKASNKKVKKSKKVTKVKVTLKKVNKKYLKSKTIKIKFKGKTYKVKTNKKGVATWKVKKSMLKKLKVGKKYKYKVTYGKDTVTKKLTIKK